MLQNGFPCLPTGREERSCPTGLNGDARIRGSKTTDPALKFTLY